MPTPPPIGAQPPTGVLPPEDAYFLTFGGGRKKC
jgi:hypothetical protein